MPEGRILECFLDEQRAAARIACPADSIPAPGQYLLAYDPASNDPLAVPLFPAGSAPEGFLVAPPLPRAWLPGRTLSLRGPLGHGFKLPLSASKVALVGLEESPAVLLSLLGPALAQGASIVLACDSPPDELPADVEVQPLAALTEICVWADYIAVHAARASLPELRAKLGRAGPAQVTREAQVLVSAPVPCGGLAECGACAVNAKNGHKLVCRDGPVFHMPDLWD